MSRDACTFQRLGGKSCKYAYAMRALLGNDHTLIKKTSMRVILGAGQICIDKYIFDIKTLKTLIKFTVRVQRDMKLDCMYSVLRLISDC